MPEKRTRLGSMNQQGTQKTTVQLLSGLLRGITRFFIRRHIPFQHFVDLAREAYVLTAKEELEKSDERINTSRISVATGITRREVKNITTGAIDAGRRSATLVSRVLNRWEQDKRYRDNRGRLRALTFSSENSDFYELVSSISQHLNPGTVLAELQRLGVVEKRGDRLKLLQADHKSDDSESWRLELAALDLNTLLMAVQDNIEHPDEELRNAHFRTEFDNIQLEAIPSLRQWIYDETEKFHSKVREKLSKKDCDVNPRLKKAGKPAGGRIIVSGIGYAERINENVVDADEE